MVISPRSKIVTLSLLIGIITLVALIITGVIGIWHKSEKTSGTGGTKMVSSKLQQVTGYAAMQHVSKQCANLKENAKESFSVLKLDCDIACYWRQELIEIAVLKDYIYARINLSSTWLKNNRKIMC